ncbi:MAG: DUF2249 domain-containing protein [Myxococcales bacterium]|nr:DUF2249 domain-containing protein [Myxococcales bacterium]
MSSPGGNAYGRRAQIVEATLALLADTRLEDVSTRQIALRVGVSQPALFRHFASRDAILEAVVEESRARLSTGADEVISGEGPALERAAGLLRLLFGHVAAHPGLLRLVLAEPTAGDAPYQAGLQQLVGRQRGLFAALVRAAVDEGSVPAGTDPDLAAALLVALIQGTLLGWLRRGRTEPLVPWADRVFAFFRAGLSGGGLAAETGPEATDEPVRPDRARLGVIDARPILAAGRDPLDPILALLDALDPSGVAVVVAPFRPSPLIALLGARGYEAVVEQPDPRTFEVIVRGPEAPKLEDLRDLEAPGPLERVLVRAAALSPGGGAHFRVPRVPRLLFPRLDERGLRHAFHEQLDGSALLAVWAPA